jgi:hypothetical protein
VTTIPTPRIRLQAVNIREQALFAGLPDAVTLGTAKRALAWLASLLMIFPRRNL